MTSMNERIPCQDRPGIDPAPERRHRAQGMAHALARDVARDAAREVARDMAHSMAHDPAQDGARDMAHDPAQDVARDMAHDPAQDVARDLAHAVAHEQARDDDRARLQDAPVRCHAGPHDHDRVDAEKAAPGEASAGQAPHRRRGILVASFTALAALAGCGGETTQELPVNQADTQVATYTGPPPATADVQAFKLNVWDNVHTDDRCGGCHGTGGQSPTFARSDDVNRAYEDVQAIVDLTSPQLSRMATKVGGGHNCWLSSNSACADIITAWISSWAGVAGDGDGGNQIVLTPPPIKDVGESKSFPDDPALFGATVHPVLTTYCAGCHSTASPLAQGPYLGNSDVESAYEAARARIDLNSPEDSRLVERLADEFHNCWGDCAANAAEMEAAIVAFAEQITPTAVDPSLLTSKALTLGDGTVASGGNRVESNVIGKWEFKTGAGNIAYDTSGVEPALDLALSGEFSWVGGWGVDLRGGKAQGSTTSSRKLHELITQTGEFSIEAWVVPGNVTQEEARIVSYSAGVFDRNFTLAQTLYSYDAYTRSSVTDANGEPLLTTAAADEDLQATLQHVVLTYDPIAGRRLYVNGEFTDDVDAGGGTLGDWDDTYAFVLGNEVSGDRPWSGVIRLVAVHNRVLSEEAIAQNFEAGVGEKFYLLFNVSDLVGLAASYVLFEVSRFDNYSYLFAEPRFVSLDPAAVPQDIPVQGMRIGVNGQEVPVGQAYANLDTLLNEADYVPGEGQPLSPIGTVVGLDQGPEGDEFFLTFERIGSFQNVRTPDTSFEVPPAVDREPASDIGIRTFAEINATMAAVTGVDPQDEDVRATYELVEQQLPTVDDIGGFLSSHQIAVAQLAIEYCNALVDDAGLRAGYFPGFDFSAAPSQAFADAQARALIFEPLTANVLGEAVGSQPDPTLVRGELNDLVDRLTACGNNCAPDKTATIVKALCSSLLGSAALLVQ